MPARVNPNEVKKIPKPPEPEFFDDLGTREERRFLVQGLLEKPWLKWTAAVTIPLVLALIFFLPRGTEKKKTFQVIPIEKRELLTRDSVDRAIEKTKKERDETPRALKKESRLTLKRNYATDIAVYVQKDERDKTQSSRDGRTVRDEKKPVGLPAGTEIPALLGNRIFSFNVAAPVTAFVAKDFTWKGKVVIPKDSRFLGEASVLKSLDRINVNFDLLIFPDGEERRIRAMALAEDGSSGILGKVEKHGDVKVLKAIGETLLGGTALFVGARSRDPFNLEDELRLNLTQNLTNQAAQDLRSVRVEKSITVEADTPIQVILLEAI